MADEIDVYKEWLGIPEGDRPPDHYTLLRLVMFEDDADRVRTNYRKLNNHIRKYATGQYLRQSQDLLNELAKAMLCLTDPTAKHDYDESLGRDPADVVDDETQTALQYLVAKGVLKRNQLTEVEHFAEARGLSHRDALVQMKLADAETATQAMAIELRLPFVDLDDMLPEDDVLDQVPKNVVKRHTCLPLFEDNGRLLVACADEPQPALEDELRLRFGIPMRPVLAVPEASTRRSRSTTLRENAAKRDLFRTLMFPPQIRSRRNQSRKPAPIRHRNRRKRNAPATFH